MNIGTAILLPVSPKTIDHRIKQKERVDIFHIARTENCNTKRPLFVATFKVKLKSSFVSILQYIVINRGILIIKLPLSRLLT